MPRILLRFSPLYLLFILFLSACAAARPPIPPMNTALPRTATPQVQPTHQSLTATSDPVGLSPTSAACSAGAGSIEKGVVASELLYKPMSYNVYLPPCYNADQNQRYPVLYLLHGQGSTEEQWIRVGAVSAADRIITSGDVQPFIIVFPYDFSYKQPNEYKFEEVFTGLLIPQIDRIYRTKSDSSHRAIGGLSRGGAWALRMGTRNPDLFSAVGGHSPAIFYVDEKPLTRRLLEIPPDLMPRIWLDAGDKDSEFDVIGPFEKFLSANNIPHEWHEYIGWHDEKYWSAHVEEYLRWYALGWDR
jgi:enterochelin esterase-like enzyme